MTRIVLLDLDGTLTDPFVGISRCIIHALEKLGLPVPGQGEQHAWIGPPLVETFGRYFEQLGEGDVDLAIGYYRERFTQIGMFENTVYDGIPGMLAKLSENGRRLFLATAKPGVFAERIVEHFGLSQWLQRSYGSELDGTRNDKVDLLQHIIDMEQLDPADCVMVGDRKYDMQAARYHGMRAIGVLWGYGSEAELLDAGAEVLIRMPKQLLKVLRE